MIIKTGEFILSKDLRINYWCKLFIETKYFRQVITIIIITIVTGIIGQKAYAQTIIEDKEKLKDNFTLSRNTEENQKTDQFIVDNNIYKIISNRDKNEVMFWKCGILNNHPQLIIKNTIEYNGENFNVTYIYENAFQDNNKDLKNITIEDGILGFCDEKGNYVEKLNKTFCNKRKLESVNFGNTKVVFGDQCFENCNAISNIKIPESMNNMCTGCFNNCFAITNVDISGISRLNGNGIFRNCYSLNNIGKFNDELIELPDETFSGCAKLSSVDLNNITKLGNECFEKCKISNPNIAVNVKEIGDRCFYKCSFKEIYLKKAEKIGLNAFGSCGVLTKVRFGNPFIPSLLGKITEDSPVNEWIYPLEYKNQPGYLSFLDKLRMSRVVWNTNYGNNTEVVTNGVKINSLEAPKIIREGYKIAGWYKEPECINEVTMIADLAITSGSDLVLKDPRLYAKWVCEDENKGESNSKDSKNHNDGEKAHDNSKGTSEDIQKETGNNTGKETNSTNSKETDNNTGKSADSTDVSQRDSSSSKQNSNIQSETEFEHEKKQKDNGKKETNKHEDIDINNLNKFRNSHKKKKENKNSIDSKKYITCDFLGEKKFINFYFKGDENSISSSITGFNLNRIIIPSYFRAYNYYAKLNKLLVKAGNNKIYSQMINKTVSK